VTCDMPISDKGVDCRALHDTDPMNSDMTKSVHFSQTKGLRTATM